MKILNSKPVLNIFSKSKTFSKKEIQNKEKIKMIADYRERNCFVASELIHLGFEVEFKELKVGDYIVKDVVIERKTISDFISSMINKRLSRQLEELQQYKNKLLIIEGFDEQELYNDDDAAMRFHRRQLEIAQLQLKGKSVPNSGGSPMEKKTARLFLGVSGNAIRGFLLSIVLKHKVPIIFTKNSQDTAKFISVLSKKQSKEISLNAKKKSLNKKEQMQFILEGFPGIGPKNAKNLLTKFKTIQNIINASPKTLQKTIGKKAEIFELTKMKY